MELNSLVSHQKLNNLSELLTEALEIEKCSICLESVNDTVLLWPCAHWFCKDCTERMQKSDQTDGRKMSCPLCKKSSARRKVLPFDDQQKEYANCVQSIIGALSLDLGFDITSYRKQDKSCITTTRNINLEPNQDTNSSPVRKAKRCVNKILPDKSKNISNKRITRKSKRDLASKPEVFKTPNPPSPPRTPENSFSKEIKVKKWLNSTRFSQADEDFTENVVIVDVHKPANGSLDSEEQLESVTQLDCKQAKTPFTRKVRKRAPNTPSDIDAIRPFDTSTPNKPVSKDISVDQFDELISEKRKFQTIKTTYGENSSRRKRRKIVVESDIFKSLESIENKNNFEDSPKSLEDFSSGSGEEWTVEKSMETKTKSINTKKVTPRLKLKETPEKGHRKNTRNKDIRSLFPKSNKIKLEDGLSVSHTTKPGTKIKDKTNKNNDGSKGTLKNMGKRISADWDDSDNEAEEQSNTREKSLESNVLKESTQPNIKRKPLVPLTPKKEEKTRSPGWSRLKSTKKEFHMSEKKKLSLKTLNKSKLSSNLDIGITNIPKKVEDSDLIAKKITSISDCSLNDKVELSKCAIVPTKSILEKSCVEEISNFQPNNNESVNVLPVGNALEVPNRSMLQSDKSVSSSSSDSPFRGFVSLEVRKEMVKSSRLKECIVSDTEFVEATCTLPTSKNNSKVSPIEVPLDISIGNVNKTVGLPLKGFKSPETRNEMCAVLQNAETIKTPNLINIPQTENAAGNELPNKVNRIICGSQSEIPIVNTIPCKANDVKEDESFTTRKTKDDYLHTDMIAQKTDSANQVSTKITKMGFEREFKIMARKLDRDSGIHNISSVGSPLANRTLVDAEVQMTPSDLQTFTKYLVENIWGAQVRAELEEAISRSVIGQAKSTITQLSQHNKLTDNNTNSDCALVGGSLDSDKENICIPNFISNITDKLLNDSDIVMGTEELAGLQRKDNIDQILCSSKKFTTNTPKIQLEKYPYLYSQFDVDPDAPTQPYKTPLVPKPSLATPGGLLFSAISNPTESELKRADTVFEKDEVLFPEETPKARSLWQDSGIDQLLELSEQKGISEDIPASCTSSTIKEKGNRSRRQLDFVGEDSNDMFEVGKNDDEEAVLKEDSVLKNMDDVIMKDDDVIETCKPTLDEDRLSIGDEVWSANFTSQKNENILAKDEKVEGLLIEDQLDVVDVPNLMEANHNEIGRTPAVLDHPEDSNPCSESSIVEGTPDISQTELQPKGEALAGSQDKTEPPKLIHLDISKDIPDNSKSRRSQNETIEEVTTETPVKLPEQMCESEDQEDEVSCLASSLLTPQQRKMLISMCEQFDVQLSPTVGPHISHLIVNTTEDGRAQNTYKFLHAMALHKPIVRFEWVQEVMRLGKTLPLDPFIALDANGECGLFRANLDTKRELLKDFAIHIYNTVESLVQKEQIEELVRLCGGWVITRLDQFHMIPRDRFRIIVLSDSMQTQPGWREQYSAAEVWVDWIYNTISQYRVNPLTKFMDDTPDNVSFLLRQGYPPELINET